jgi:hypothetical protein
MFDSRQACPVCVLFPEANLDGGCLVAAVPVTEQSYLFFLLQVIEAQFNVLVSWHPPVELEKGIVVLYLYYLALLELLRKAHVDHLVRKAYQILQDRKGSLCTFPYESGNRDYGPL